MAKKNILTSAKGIVEPYAYLTKPDYGNEAFKQPRGLYKCSLTIDSDSKRCKEMIAEIDKAHKESYEQRLEEYKANPPQIQKGKKPLLPYEGDMPYMDNEDGTTTFNFKSYASWQKDGELLPLPMRVVDSRGKPVTNLAFIGGGSEIRVRYSLFPYGWSAVAGASVKLQLEGVMLVTLADFAGGDDWSEFAEDGGFVAEDTPTRSAPSSDSDYQEPDENDQGNEGDF